MPESHRPASHPPKGKAVPSPKAGGRRVPGRETKASAAVVVFLAAH